MKELTALLDSNHIIKNGIVDTTVAHDVPSKDYERIEDIVRYIDNVHGYKTLQPFFEQELDSVIPPEGEKRIPEWRSNSDIIVDLMKLNKIYSAGDSTEESSRYFKNTANEMMSSTGYDFVSGFTLNSYYFSDTTKFVLKDDTLYLWYSDSVRRINISYRNMEPLALETGSVLDTVYESGDNNLAGPAKSPLKNIHLSDFAIESDNKEWKAKVVFSELRINRKSGRTLLDYASAVLFVKMANDVENEVGERKE